MAKQYMTFVQCFGLVNGELADSVILIAPQFQTTANRNSGVGEYTITCSGAVQNGNNYDISYGSGLLHVTKAPLNIKVDNLTRTYGDDEPNYKISYEGFKNGEDEQVLKHLPVAYKRKQKIQRRAIPNCAERCRGR